jgi:hypothetical protein
MFEYGTFRAVEQFSFGSFPVGLYYDGAIYAGSFHDGKSETFSLKVNNYIFHSEAG